MDSEQTFACCFDDEANTESVNFEIMNDGVNFMVRYIGCIESKNFSSFKKTSYNFLLFNFSFHINETAGLSVTIPGCQRMHQSSL